MSDMDARKAFIRAQARNIRERRERLAGQMAELQADIEYWNRTHPDEEPIVLSPDLTPDIEALKNAR